MSQFPMPTEFSDGAEQGGGYNDSIYTGGIIPHDAIADFTIKNAEISQKPYKNNKAGCIKLVLLCEQHDVKISSIIWHDVYIDGRIWNAKDKRGQNWVQNQFLSLMTGVSLRKKKGTKVINALWFSQMGLYLGKKGIVKVQVREYEDRENGTMKQVNSVCWFNSPNNDQAQHNNAINDQYLQLKPNTHEQHDEVNQAEFDNESFNQEQPPANDTTWI